MRITRFVEDGQGGSSFRDLDVAFVDSFRDPLGGTHGKTRTFTTPAVMVELSGEMDPGWHAAPLRRIVVVLTGQIEVEVTDGEVRRWGPGDVILVDDTHGRGHRTRVLGSSARLLFLEVGPDFDPEAWGRP